MPKDLIHHELDEVKTLCEHVVKGSKLISCVQTMVRVELRITSYKCVIVCIQFPEHYPQEPLLIELKSNTLSSKLLDGLTNVCDQETRKILGRPQVLTILKFVHNFIDVNPLCCCYNEILSIRNTLADSDELKLRQKSSSLYLKVSEQNYYFTTYVGVPSNYPQSCISLDNCETNFPPVFKRFLCAHLHEIARQCVEAPLKTTPNQPPFKPVPSLQRVISILINAIKKLPHEKCQLCQLHCFPQNPQVVVTNESSDQHVERVLCGHLFHQQCLISFMKSPPFKGGKKCPNCSKPINHHKWKLNDQLAEDRWAHQQARQRELEEVQDFLY